MKQIFKLNKIMLVLFIMSCPFLTLSLSARFGEIYQYISFFLSYIVSVIIGVKYIDKIEYSKKILIISGLIALYTGKILSNFYAVNIVSIVSLPAICILIYMFITKLLPKIKDEYLNLTDLEKKYIIITFIVAILITGVMGYFTELFYNPSPHGDIIYTSDTFGLVENDAFANINHQENDMRQPLFGVFALPFAIIAHFFSEILFFLPNKISYGMMLSIIQIVLLAIIVIMITKILKVDEKSKVLFYLMFIVSAPYLVFSLCVEQYVIAIFYLILTMYIFFCKEVEVNYSYIGAVSTLLTSGIIFPMTTNSKGIKKYIENTLKCFLAFLVVLIISGQLPQFIANNRIGYMLEEWTKGVTFENRFYQFVNFVKSTLFFPESDILRRGPVYIIKLMQTSAIEILGVIIFVAVVAGFILNYKDKFAQVCISWVAFSALILLFIGWGTVENGMFLYSLYFFWAYLCLIYMGITKICKNVRHINISMTLLIIIMFSYNLPYFINFISFAVRHY